MSSEIININNILIDKSRFSLRNYLFEIDSKPSTLYHSFDTLGIMYPIIVYKDIDGRLHLVDGKKRIQFVKKSGGEKVRATILPEMTPLTDVVTLIFNNRKSGIEASVINKMQFIYFAMSLGISESWILESLCLPLELKPHSGFLRECGNICNLPIKLRLFCHEKRFSLKQVLNLTQNPPDLLTQLVKWKSNLRLTASILDELASNLRAYLKRENKKLGDFLSEPDVQEIFDSSLGNQEKTDRLRLLLRLRNYPILTEVNSRIEQNIEKLKLPKEMTFNWDKTLENKNLEISIHLKDPKRWGKLLETLNSEELRASVKAILDEL